MSSKIRLYFSDKIKSELVSHITKDQTHYVKDVMRLKIGDNLSVFNSLGEWNAVIESYEKEGARIKILEKIKDKENEKNIWLAFSPIKQNPLNFIIQKGTELGVQKFLPILSERSIVKEVNIERIQKIIVESSEQSNRISVPEIRKIETLNFFLSQFPKDGCLIFCDINCNKNNLKSILSKKLKSRYVFLLDLKETFPKRKEN